MKIISCDNFARETLAERVVVEGLDQRQAEAKLAELLASRHGPDDSTWYRIVPDDYRLWGGMEEYV
jgi:hypothetical protein